MIHVVRCCAVQVLLEGGATIELQDALGRSALMFAAGNGATAACQVRNAPLHHVHLIHGMMNGFLQSFCGGLHCNSSMPGT
jgi:ankyrin repeat protein